MATATGDSCSISLVPSENPDEIHLRTVTLGGFGGKHLCTGSQLSKHGPVGINFSTSRVCTCKSPVSGNMWAQGKAQWLPCEKPTRAYSELVTRAAVGARPGAIRIRHDA